MKKEIYRLIIKPIIFILFFIMILSITNCAQSSSSNQVGACSGHPLVGKWKYGSDILTFNDDCTGSNLTCEYKFTWDKSALTSETTIINLTSAKDLNYVCAKPGNIEVYAQRYNVAEEVLHIDDGYNYYVYGRVK